MALVDPFLSEIQYRYFMPEF